jgi:hypothetical protein
MGRFTYEGSVRTEIDDRILLHLQIVIAGKLRRHESFTFTWRDDASTGTGRTAVWMHPGASIVFSYYGSRPAAVNRRWLEALAYTANSPVGLHVVPEPEDTDAAMLTGEREKLSSRHSARHLP